MTNDIYQYDPVAANNNAAPPFGWPENMDYRDVNNAAREFLSSVARWRIAALSGIKTTANVGNAYTLTSGQNYPASPAYITGMTFAFTLNASVTGPATLNVDGCGVRNLVDARGAQIGAGSAQDLTANGVYMVVVRSADIQVIGALTAASLSAILNSAARTPLTANVTYFVRADGNDANTGLADSAGGGFLTIQKAIDTIYNTLDLKGFTATIQVRTGTFARAVVANPQVGNGSVVLQGDSVTPANVILTATGIGSSNGVVDVRNGAVITVKDLSVNSVTSGDCFYAEKNGVILFQNIRFGACGSFHIDARDEGLAVCTGNYAITGAAQRHFSASNLGHIRVNSFTVTITGTPAFSDTFASADNGGVANISGNTWSGSATGRRFVVASNGFINDTGGISALPGDVAGTVATGGIHPALNARETIYIPAGAMTAQETTGPASNSIVMTTNRNVIKSLDFDTSTQEFAQFEVWMPKAWDLGTITAQFEWSHAATATNFGVVWNIAGVARSDNDAQDVAFGTAQQIADTGGTTNNLYQTAETPAVTIAGSPAVGDSVLFRFGRVPADGSDTLAIDARLQGVRIFFNTNNTTDA